MEHLKLTDAEEKIVRKGMMDAFRMISPQMHIEYMKTVVGLSIDNITGVVIGPPNSGMVGPDFV